MIFFCAWSIWFGAPLQRKVKRQLPLQVQCTVLLWTSPVYLSRHRVFPAQQNQDQKALSLIMGAKTNRTVMLGIFACLAFFAVAEETVSKEKQTPAVGSLGTREIEAQLQV